MIPQSFIQDLLNRVDIVDVVGRYVQLKKVARISAASAPFITKNLPALRSVPPSSFITALVVVRTALRLVF
jgi:DNA primase